MIERLSQHLDERSALMSKRTRTGPKKEAAWSKKKCWVMRLLKRRPDNYLPTR